MKKLLVIQFKQFLSREQQASIKKMIDGVLADTNYVGFIVDGMDEAKVIMEGGVESETERQETITRISELKTTYDLP